MSLKSENNQKSNNNNQKVANNVITQFQGETLVIGHGRNHSNLVNLDYDKTIFLDKDPNCGADIVVDFHEFDVDVFDRTFDNIIITSCENQILLDGNPITWSNRFVEKPEFEFAAVEKLYKLLKPNGILYFRGLYWFSDGELTSYLWDENVQYYLTSILTRSHFLLVNRTNLVYNYKELNHTAKSCLWGVRKMTSFELVI